MMYARFTLAILLPFVALVLQWMMWPWISPFVWFLFFPTIFFSARLGGLRGGLVSTLLSAAIVWYFFIPPQLSWHMNNPANAYSVIVFMLMGYLFSQTHERLRRTQHQAEEALATAQTANEEVTRLYQQTLELDELKSQFFANISHELRTPLTLIMSPLNRRLAMQDLPETLRHEDEMMLRNARLLYRQVSDLLDAAKLEAGKMTINYAKIDIAGLSRTVAAQFDSIAKERNIEFLINIPSAVSCQADAEKLQRVLLNLLSNAFKFTLEGGRIEVRVRTKEDQAVIEVQDNGPGIPAEQRNIIFERFRQVDGGTQRHFGGTGLGLAIVKEFVVLHRGLVNVDDAPGGGALFVVRIPLHAPANAVIHEQATEIDPLLSVQATEATSPSKPLVLPQETSNANPNTPLILVVEDNPDLNTFITNTLAAHYRVASAFDGKEGLTQALACTPDLIISDVMMPNLSGDLMVQALRQHEALKDVPVIILTAKADDELRIQLFKNGIQGYINKPFGVEELLTRATALLDKRRYEQEALLQRDKRFNDIVGASADWIWETDTDGHYTYTSDSIHELLGYTPDEVLGKTLFDLMPSEEALHLKPSLEGLYARKEIFRDLDIIVTDKAGSQHAIQTTGIPKTSANGVFFGYRGLGRDVTTQKQAEERLRISEERLQLALTATNDGLWDWDLRNDWAYLAPRYYEMIGYRAGEAIPNLAFFKRTVHPDDLQRVLATIEAHLRGETPISEVDYRLLTGSGQTKWVRGRGMVVARDTAGQAVRMVGTITDINNQKLSEEFLRRQTEELSQRNAELERFNRATVGRELDMIELKHQVNTLSLALGKAAPFPNTSDPHA